jgi:hypothetical protein
MGGILHGVVEAGCALFARYLGGLAAFGTKSAFAGI